MGFKFLTKNINHFVERERRWVEMQIPYGRGAEALRIRAYTDMDYIQLEGIINRFVFEPADQYTVRNIYNTLSTYCNEVEVLQQF
jgi:hypothetical protein